MKKLLMAAMGQSCGGAQVLGVAYDPRIKTCVMLNSKDGHSGTYYEKYGGNYAKAVIKWLDWQLKGQVGQSALFLDDEYLKMKFPEWQGVRKNF